MEEYALASEEADYENPGEEAPMKFMPLGRENQGSENTPPWMDRKCSPLTSLTGTDNTNWETENVHMGVAEEAIRKATGRFNTPMEFWGCTNSPRYHADRFHTYINCPNKTDPFISERENQSVQEYDPHTSMMGGSRGDQDDQWKGGQTSSMAGRSMFEERRVKIARSWEEEGFESLYHVILICEMMGPSTSKSVRLACAGALNDIQSIKGQL